MVVYEVICQCQITRKARGSLVKKETVKGKKANSNKEKVNSNKSIKDNNAHNKTIVK